MWGRGSQLSAGEMAKHKPYKFACSILRLEGPALRKCNTKTRKAVEKRSTDEVKTLKAEKPRTHRVANWWKTETGIAKDENKTWKHTRTVATSHA